MKGCRGGCASYMLAAFLATVTGFALISNGYSLRDALVASGLVLLASFVVFLIVYRVMGEA